jgi:ABC-2 type transport system ATP-binding protein
MADDPVAFKSRMGYVPEEPQLYTHLTGLEYLVFVGRLRGISFSTSSRRANELMQLLELGNARNVPMSSYSKGMRQRIPR